MPLVDYHSGLKMNTVLGEKYLSVSSTHFRVEAPESLFVGIFHFSLFKVSDQLIFNLYVSLDQS